MKRKLIILGIAIFLLISLTACETPNKGDEVVKDKVYESVWDGKVEVSITFPREVEQGKSFSVEITTKNISGAVIEHWSGSCCQNKGVMITGIKLQSKVEYEMKHWHFSDHDDDMVLTIIPIGGSLVTLWEIETIHPETFKAGVAPKGKYDIHLSNGEVYRNAIKVK